MQGTDRRKEKPNGTRPLQSCPLLKGYQRKSKVRERPFAVTRVFFRCLRKFTEYSDGSNCKSPTPRIRGGESQSVILFRRRRKSYRSRHAAVWFRRQRLYQCMSSQLSCNESQMSVSVPVEQWISLGLGQRPRLEHLTCIVASASNAHSPSSTLSRQLRGRRSSSDIASICCSLAGPAQQWLK